ncbi:MAG: 6-phosphofructokinase, partial [Acidobacteriota bacterium]|nr:6-phosphofructokinase [Acidobacteriota bacterium]
MDKIGIITPGGDAPGINAAIGTVLRLSKNDKKTIIGINDGFKGLVKEDFTDLKDVSYEWLMGVSGTILHSERMSSFKKKDVLKRASRNIIDNGIEGLLVIGGDGSFIGALALQKISGIPVVGIPATIDNDIFGTEETIGFDTACNTALEA